MSASDEAYHGGGAERPMTIPELCARGPFKGVIRYEMYEHQNIATYSNAVWTVTMASLVIGMLTLVYINAAIGMLLFVGCSLGSLAVAALKTLVSNLALYEKLDYLQGDERTPFASSMMIHKLIQNPLPGTIYIFRFPNTRTKSPLPTTNLSDGMGNMLLFVRFDDDHDRVMFRLSM